MHWSPELGAWVITRYEDVMAAVLDPRLANDRVSVNLASLDGPLFERCAPLGARVQLARFQRSAPPHQDAPARLDNSERTACLGHILASGNLSRQKP